MLFPSTANSKPPEPLLVKPRDACRLLACGRTRLYQLIASKEIDSFTDGGSRKITTSSIHEFIARQLAAAGVR